MRKKLTNTRVINSIGIGILAMVTAGTPVLAEINDTVNDNNSAADTNASDIPAEPVEQPAPTQNEQILQMLSDAQSTIQEVQSSLQQTPEGSCPIQREPIFPRRCCQRKLPECRKKQGRRKDL